MKSNYHKCAEAIYNANVMSHTWQQKIDTYALLIEKFFPPKRELSPKEKEKGRSSGYWEMEPEDQWAEDKRLGILDWDGN